MSLLKFYFLLATIIALGFPNRIPAADETIEEQFAALPPFFHDGTPAAKADAPTEVSFNPRNYLELARHPDGGKVIPHVMRSPM
jgi:hypothetical protein